MKVYRPVPLERARGATPASPDRTSLERVGIIDDMLDPPLIEGVVDALRALLPAASVEVWTKPVGTSPAPEPLIDEIAGEVQVALAGVGM